MKLNWNFLGGREVQNKKPSVGRGSMGYFLELPITNLPIIWTTTKSPAKINYRCLTEMNSCYYGLSLIRTLTCGPESVCNKGS